MRLIENFVSLGFGYEMKKIYHGMVKNFRFGVNKFPLVLWFPMIQNRLLNTFHQPRLGKQQFFLDSSEKTVMPALRNILGEFMVPNDTERTTVTRGLCSLWYYLVKYMTRS